MSVVNIALKYRIYPTRNQETLFLKTFGCCRKVWNLMLADRESAYKADKTILKPTPARYKTDFPYLREVDALALANVQLAQEKAFTRFFREKDVGRPKFKSKKHSNDSYTTNNQHGTVAIKPELSVIRLPKAGFIKAVLHRLPKEDWRLKSATVSRTHDHKFYCSVLFEYDAEIVPVQDAWKNAIGLDYKSDGFYVTSDGLVRGSQEHFRKAQKALTREQRKLRHKTPGSRNYEKQKIRIARRQVKTANQRKDFLHKESAAIAKRYDLVAVESINMRAMANKSFHNGKATMDNGYGMFLDMLDYKLHRQGKSLIRVDKWFPSSQLCHKCGFKNPAVKDLKVRSWACPNCGEVHDRDINAAINIRNEGIRLYMLAKS